VCDGRAGGATTDAWRQRPLAVTSAASQASDCVGSGRESVAAPTDASVVLGRNRPYWTTSVGATDAGAILYGHIC
jgi:hypothetical protein